MRIALIALLTCTISPLLAGSRDRAAAIHAEGCRDTRLSACDATYRGRLAPGDCVFSIDGTRYDTIVFTPPRTASEIAVTLRPLDASFTSPMMFVNEPLSSQADAPLMSDGRAITSTFVSESSDNWYITVNTRDVTASGEYTLHFACTPREPIDFGGVNCVTQQLVCGNRGDGMLSADSCTFSNAPRVYQEWKFYGAARETVTISMEAFGFTPAFDIYNEDDDLLMSGKPERFQPTKANFRVPEDGWYYIVATSAENNEGGTYDIALDCARSGCIAPYLVSNIPSLSVDRGTPAVINLDLNVHGPFVASLRQDMETLATSTTTQIVTPPVLSPAPLVVHVESPCGATVSNVFTVSPSMSRRRSVKH